MKILITGVAGFIGANLAQELLKCKHTVFGIDNINDYYDINLKLSRLRSLGIETENIKSGIEIGGLEGFIFLKLDLNNRDALFDLFNTGKFDIVVNLAAQAGVRYSLENPDAYIQSNILGFYNILEASKQFKIKHLIFASSSSVYGNSNEVPFRTDQRTDEPISLYAATKKSNEVIAYSYSHLYGLPITGLRFFTVYGPWGRPDMAYFIFTQKVLTGQKITLFNDGDMFRDYTYVGDVVKSISKLIVLPPSDGNYYRILNVGNQKVIRMLDFVTILENILGIKANLAFDEKQKGDVDITFSDSGEIEKLINFVPNTSLEEGLSSFVEWYKGYCQID
jgi:UDP-glucuronate 4-epimerase